MARIAPIQSVPPPAQDDSDKDRPLREDIRLLGRILGDTVREQEGEEVFELVEQIRKASIRFHRDNEVAARREVRREAARRRWWSATLHPRRQP